MCGINGFVGKDDTLIRAMNEVCRYRGPDDEGFYTDGMVTLAHRRLSIIDLSPLGHQPMCNEDETVWLTYNGEIYNFQEIREDLVAKGHRFRSRTDSEVIIHAYEEYGPDCVKRFNGMWAFCIYDIGKKRLFLSRDRFGIKPLYYHASGERFVFSSMIGGILCHGVPAAPNEKAIMEYLAYNLLNHDRNTFFQNIHNLEPGATLTYDLETRKLHTAKWYALAPRAVRDERDIRAAFIESVRRRTIADVPVGSCLSGGVDSSAIVCTLDKFFDNTFNTFSLVSPGEAKDETRYIKAVGEATNVNQYFTTLKPEEFLHDIDDFVRAQEEPVTSLSMYAQYRVMKLAHEHDAKVLLDGQGGDELFAGYVYYYSYYFYELFKGLRWGRLLAEAIGFVRKTRRTLPLQMFAFMMLPAALRTALFEKRVNPWVNHAYLRASGAQRDPRWNRLDLRQGLELTLFHTAIPHLLRYEDKNSMRWSIETRVPFLDYEMVETAYSLPPEQKLRDGRTKVGFREAVRDIIPEAIYNRTDKIGFIAPADTFFRHPAVAAFARAILHSESFASRPYWHTPTVRQLFQDHLDRKKNIGDTLWKWVNTELWLRAYFG